MIKILQFGEGNFLRSFVDHYFQTLNDEGGDYSVNIIKPRPSGSLEKFAKQKNVYHVVLRGSENGKAVENVFEIRSVKSVTNPFEDYESYIAFARDEELKLVVSNTTEAGICFDEKDGFSGFETVTYPAKLTKFLFERFNSGLDGVYLLPVELIENNADELKKCVLQYAALWKLPQAFCEWIEKENYFCNTLVDRIVSGYPKDEETKLRMEKLVGEKDELLSVGEPFGLWAIEEKGEIKKYIKGGFHGVEVVLTKDIGYYKKRKVRVLNGSHTNLVPYGLWHGFETVFDCMNDGDTFKFVCDTMENEIIPFVSTDIEATRSFASSVVDRFNNPFLNHQLTSIALNGVSKWRARVLPSFRDYYARYGVIPCNLTTGFAYLVALYKAVKKVDGKFVVDLPTRRIELKDEEKHLEYFANGGSVINFMKDVSTWGEDLTEYAGFFEAVGSVVRSLVGEETDKLIINEKDNVAVLLTERNGIPAGHKIALCDVEKGEYFVKYGQIIGRATQDVKAGEWVHSHNLKSHLDENVKYRYEPDIVEVKGESKTFLGFKREKGAAGVRNEIYVVPTVGCVNNVCRKIEKLAQKFVTGSLDGIFALTHQFGCSQLGDDQINIRNLLCNVAMNPNASFVLFVGLGCENNGLDGVKAQLEKHGRNNIAYFNCQEVEDEVSYGLEIVKGFAERAKDFKREEVPFSDLCIGLKCGGSDGFSGITANPLVGKVTDMLVGAGASAILTEVPEMFGAEQLLMNKCESKEVFEKYKKTIVDFKAFYTSNGFPVYENPSPGNKAGGITTLEEKSLGCVQKAGCTKIVDVLDYGELQKKSGVSVLNAPGNDLIAATALASAGCQIVLFTTGRGTPFSTFVPTMKIASNDKISSFKENWIDFNAYSMDENGLFDLIKKTANGEYKCKNEDIREIAFYKTGVTL